MGNQYIRIAKTKEIPLGQGKAYAIGSLHLAIFHTGDGFFATNDICSHELEHLHEGYLEGCTVECPRHGSQFDLKTGEALTLPAMDPIEVFELKIENDEIMVNIPDEYVSTQGVGKVV